MSLHQSYVDDDSGPLVQDSLNHTYDYSCTNYPRWLPGHSRPLENLVVLITRFNETPGRYIVLSNSNVPIIDTFLRTILARGKFYYGVTQANLAIGTICIPEIFLGINQICLATRSLTYL